jgi:hypothetical protein
MLTVSENHARTIRIAMEQERQSQKARGNAGDPARSTQLVEAA